MKSLDILLGVANSFVGEYGGIRTRLHARDGVLAASDGRILIHIESPLVKAMDGSDAKVLDFEPEVGLFRADANWLVSTLFPIVGLENQKDYLRYKKIKADFDSGVGRRHVVPCLCCGEELVVESEYSIVTYEDWLMDNEPDRKLNSSSISLIPPSGPIVPFCVYYLETAILAAQELGAVTELRVTQNQLVLIGEYWYIVLMKLREPRDPNVCVMMPRQEGGTPSESAR